MLAREERARSARARIVCERQHNWSHRRADVARDGSAAAFDLLRLPEALLVDCVLPQVPLGCLAKLALQSETLAALVVSHLKQPTRWQHVAARMEPIWLARSTVELIERMYEFDDECFEIYVDRPPASGSAFQGRGCRFSQARWISADISDTTLCSRFEGLDGLMLGSVEMRKEAAIAVVQVRLCEAANLKRLVLALGYQLDPASMLDLLRSLSKQLCAPWPSWFKEKTVYAPRYEKRRPRMDISVMVRYDPPWDEKHFVLRSRRGAWSAQNLADLIEMFETPGWQADPGWLDTRVFVPPNIRDGEAEDELLSILTRDLSLSQRGRFVMRYFLGEDSVCAHGGVAFLSTPCCRRPYSMDLVAEIALALSIEVSSDVANVSADDDTVDYSPGELRLVHSAPAELLSEWSVRADFPLAFTLEDVALLLDKMALFRADFQTYFDGVKLGWVERLLGDDRHAHTDKVYEVSRRRQA